MKSDKSKLKSRIKELEVLEVNLKAQADKKMEEGQFLQQEIAQINTSRLKNMGAIEELKKQVDTV